MHLCRPITYFCLLLAFATKTGRKEKLPKELQCGALFGERRKDIFSELEILSALQKYLLPVKRCLHFSAESPWICLEAVIHND